MTQLSVPAVYDNGTFDESADSFDLSTWVSLLPTPILAQVNAEPTHSELPTVRQRHEGCCHTLLRRCTRLSSQFSCDCAMNPPHALQHLNTSTALLSSNLGILSPESSRNGTLRTTPVNQFIVQASSKMSCPSYRAAGAVHCDEVMWPLLYFIHVCSASSVHLMLCLSCLPMLQSSLTDSCHGKIQSSQISQYGMQLQYIVL